MFDMGSLGFASGVGFPWERDDMRPLKLTPKVQAALCEAISEGVPDRWAAPLAGISARTLKGWRAAAKTADPRTALAKLDAALEMVDARFVLFHIAAMKACDKPGLWQKHSWMLERRPDSPFALIQKTEIGAPGEFQKLNADDVRAEILRLVGKAPRTGTVKVGGRDT